MTERYVRMPLAALARQDVAPAARLVYAALLSFAWDDPGCYPSTAQLAECAGVAERTVRRSLDELRAPAVGWLGVESAAGRRHHYRLLGPRPRPDPGPVNGSTPVKLSGVGRNVTASLTGVPASLTGVVGHFDQGTPDILSPKRNPRTKPQEQNPITKGEAVPNSEHARAGEEKNWPTKIRTAHEEMRALRERRFEGPR